jgi:hypothetical protein
MVIFLGSDAEIHPLICPFTDNYISNVKSISCISCLILSHLKHLFGSLQAEKLHTKTLPYPYTSKEVFEQSIRMPIGPEFNPATAIGALNRPEVSPIAAKLFLFFWKIVWSITFITLGFGSLYTLEHTYLWFCKCFLNLRCVV